MEDYTFSLNIDDTFTFHCTPDVPCFNECCRDLNTFLTPYDVMRLKNALNLTSTDFLDQYTMTHTGPESGLPIVTLVPRQGNDLVCPFVTEEGCSVYPDRPSACRIYPLARAIKRSRETGEIVEYFMLVKEPHCKGHGNGKTQTVRSWIIDQELPVYNTLNDLMMEIISLKNRMLPGSLDQKSKNILYTTCYDLDKFKTEIDHGTVTEDLVLSSELLAKIKNDELTRLKFGHIWAKLKLFGIHPDRKTMKELEETA